MYKEEAMMFKALSDPHRLQLLELLIQGETCGCTLIEKVPVSQPTLSYHLNILVKVGLAMKVREGTKYKYYVQKEKVSQLQTLLDTILTSTATCEVSS